MVSEAHPSRTGLDRGPLILWDGLRFLGIAPVGSLEALLSTEVANPSKSMPRWRKWHQEVCSYTAHFLPVLRGATRTLEIRRTFPLDLVPSSMIDSSYFLFCCLVSILCYPASWRKKLRAIMWLLLLILRLGWGVRGCGGVSLYSPAGLEPTV